MASKQDTQSRKYGSDDSQITHNHILAMQQHEKSGIRAQKVALSADKFSPYRIASYPKPIDN